MRKLLLVGAAVLLCGCQSLSDYFERKTDYRSSGPARRLPPLEVPPDLTAPTPDGRYALPEQQTAKSTATFSSYEATRREGGTPAGAKAAEILPTFEDMRIERAGTQRWLVVKAPPEQLWPVLKDFWQDNGFELEVEQPDLGVMETYWAENRAKLPLDPIRRFIGRIADRAYSTGTLDKFRTRIERSPDGGTEIYISHRGVAEVADSPRDMATSIAPTVWQPRQPDPGLEALFLRRLMVRLGAEEKTAQQLVEGGKAAERAEIRKGVDGHELLQLYEPFDRAWRRVGLALDRVGFTVEDRDRQKGLYYVRYADPAKAKDERGFFARMFSFGAEPKLTPEQYRVQVTQAGTTSQVSVLDKDGKTESSKTVSRILSLLHEQLK